MSSTVFLYFKLNILQTYTVVTIYEKYLKNLAKSYTIKDLIGQLNI